MQPLFASVRAYGPALLDGFPEPAAELLAMVWGPRFDREHARLLAQSVERDRPTVEHALAQAADHFDGMPAPQQQRLRQRIRRYASSVASGTISA